MPEARFRRISVIISTNHYSFDDNQGILTGVLHHQWQSIGGRQWRREAGIKVSTDKKNMYEILRVAPTATQAEIKAAHRRLSLEVMSGKQGLSREDVEFQLKLLDMALRTLADPTSRDVYDAKLALPVTSVPYNISLPIRTAADSRAVDETAGKLAAAVVDEYRTTVAAIEGHKIELEAVSSTVRASASALRAILRIVAGLLILGFVLKMGQMALAARKPTTPSIHIARAEEMLIIQQFHKKYGVRPASRAEAELLEREYRRKENEERQAQFEKDKMESEQRDFDEESRRMGERVHENLAHAEERARYMEQLRQQDLRRQRDSQGQSSWPEQRDAAEQ